MGRSDTGSSDGMFVKPTPPTVTTRKREREEKKKSHHNENTRGSKITARFSACE